MASKFPPNTTTLPTGPILPVPAPWKLRGTVYLFAWWQSPSATRANGLPPIAYSPHEASTPFASPPSSKPVGGISMVQIIRYTESPVGPYDELILAPGYHEYVREEGKDGKRVVKKHPRITRIYVSQKYTTWNGRRNWGVPKHLAKFTFKDNADGSTTVQVFPHDSATAPDMLTTESTPSTIPFFSATIKPVRLLPSFPVSLSLLSWVGFDATLVQPPLPEKKDAAEGELSGSEKWCAVNPGQSSRKAAVQWFDLQQPKEAVSEESGVGENFWPGLGRWHLGLKMEDAEVDFVEGVYWDPPRSLL